MGGVREQRGAFGWVEEGEEVGWVAGVRHGCGGWQAGVRGGMGSTAVRVVAARRCATSVVLQKGSAAMESGGAAVAVEIGAVRRWRRGSLTTAVELGCSE